MGYYYNGVIYPFTTPMDILRFKPLSFLNRIRFGLSSIYISLYRNIEKLESINNEQFLKKVAGKQPWEIIYKPMLKVKFGDNYKKYLLFGCGKELHPDLNLGRVEVKTRFLDMLKEVFSVLMKK